MVLGARVAGRAPGAGSQFDLAVALRDRYDHTGSGKMKKDPVAT